MTPEYLDSDQYRNFVACIAYQHNCRLREINLTERVIDIEGPPEAVYACSAELERLLGRESCR